MDNLDISLIIITIIAFLGTIVSNIAWSVKANKRSNNKILEMLEKQVNNLTEENIQLRKTIDIQNEKIDSLQKQIIELVKRKK